MPRHEVKSTGIKTRLRGKSNDSSCTTVKEGRSILKRRSRKPLQEVVDLHLTEDTNVNRSTNRRVSFAVSEIKEFRQPANEGTLWGNSYILDIQKSSSESENTESSASGFHTSSGSCGSGVVYSHVIVEETVSVSYHDVNEDGELVDDSSPDLKSNRLHELVDAGNQTDESIFQEFNKSSNPTKESYVNRGIAPQKNIQSANKANKFFYPSESLGKILQSKLNITSTNPHETFECQAPTGRLSDSYSPNDIEECSIVINPLNEYHVNNMFEPPRKSPKLVLSSCEEGSKISKRQNVENSSAGNKLQNWLRGEEGMTPVGKQQSPMINNEVHFSTPNTHDYYDKVMRNMQSYPCVSKQQVKEQEFSSSSQIEDDQYKFSEMSLDLSLACTSPETDGKRTKEHETIENASDEMSLSLSNEPLLNISSTNKENRSKSISSNNVKNIRNTLGVAVITEPSSKKPSLLCSKINKSVTNTGLTMSSHVSDSYLIEKNMSHSSRERTLDNEASSHYSGYSNRSGENITPTEVKGGRIFCVNESVTSNHSTDFVNSSNRSVSPTVVSGRILGNIQTMLSCVPGHGNTQRISPTRLDEEINYRESASFNHVSNSDNSIGVSLTMAEGKILENPCVSRGIGLELGRTGSSTMTMSSVNSHEDGVQNFISIGNNTGKHVSPINVESQILNNNQSPSHRDVSGSISPTISVGRILNKDVTSSLISGFPNINGKRKAQSMAGENITYIQALSSMFGREIVRDRSQNQLSSCGRFYDNWGDKSSSNDTDVQNHGRIVSCAKMDGKTLGNQEVASSNSDIDFQNASEQCLSPTFVGGRILDNIKYSSCNDSLENNGRRVVSTGHCEIISEVNTSSPSCVPRIQDTDSRCLSLTLTEKRMFDNHDTCVNYVNNLGNPNENIRKTKTHERISDNEKMCDHNTDLGNASRSVSPTMSAGRILGVVLGSQNNSFGNGCELMPAKRILDKIQTTDENSDFVNASRSMSLTMPLGRNIGHVQLSSQNANFKDTSGVNVSPTMSAGRILDKIHVPFENLDFVNVSRNVSSTMPVGRIIEEVQSSSQNTVINDTSGSNVSLTMHAGGVLDKICVSDENSYLASRGVSRITSKGGSAGEMQVSSQNEDFELIHGKSVIPTMPEERVLSDSQLCDDNTEFEDVNGSMCQVTSGGRILLTDQGAVCQSSDKIAACEGTLVMAENRIAMTNDVSSYEINCLSDVSRKSAEPLSPLVKENLDNKEIVYPVCTSPKSMSVTVLESTSSLRECNSDKHLHSSNENVSPRIAKSDKYISLTQNQGSIGIIKKSTAEGFIETCEKVAHHHRPTKKTENIFNTQTTAVTDLNVSHSKIVQMCDANNASMILLDETQNHSDSKTVQREDSDGNDSRSVDSDHENLEVIINNGKETIDEKKRKLDYLNEGSIDFSGMRINFKTSKVMENTGNFSTPAVVSDKNNLVESMELDNETEEKKGENTHSSNKENKNCSRREFVLNVTGKKEVNMCEHPTNETNKMEVTETCCKNNNCKEKINIDINAEDDKCLANIQPVCKDKSIEEDKHDHYRNSINSIKNGSSENNPSFCGTDNTEDMNYDAQMKSKNTDQICIEDHLSHSMSYNDNDDDMGGEEMNQVESDDELNIVSPPIKFHIGNNRVFSPGAKGKDNILTKNVKMIDKEKHAEELGVFTRESDEVMANVSCYDKSNINVNEKVINKNAVVIKTVTDTKRPSLAVSGIDYIDWKSSLDVTDELANKNQTNTVVTEAQADIPNPSTSTATIESNDCSSEIQRSDISESSVISLSNICNDDFDGANDYLIKSFRSQGREEFLKERRGSSSFHNKMPMVIIHNTPGIETCPKMLTKSLHVHPENELINVVVNLNKNNVESGRLALENKSPVLEISPVQSQGDGDVNSVGHLTPVTHDNVHPKDYLESISSTNKNSTAVTTICIENEQETIKENVKRNIELPTETLQEVKSETEGIQSLAYSESNTQKNFIDENYSPVQSQSDGDVNFIGHLTPVTHDNVHPKDYLESISSTNKNSTAVTTNCIENEQETIKENVKRNVELPTETLQEVKSETEEIQSLAYSESNTQKNFIDENYSPVQKKYTPIHKPPVLEISPVQSQSDGDVNSVDHLTSVTHDNVHPKDYLESISSTNKNSTAVTTICIENEQETIKENVKRNIELPTETLQEVKSETEEIQSLAYSERNTKKNFIDENYSPVQKKKRLSPQIASIHSTLFPSNYESFCKRDNKSLDSTSLTKYCSKVRGFKDKFKSGMSIQVVPPYTIERWIQEQQKSKNCCWKVDLISPSKINFYFMEKKLQVYIEVDPSGLNLTQIDIKCHLKGSNMRLFFHNLLLKRLKPDTLQDRFSSKDVFPDLINFISDADAFLFDFAKDWLDLEVTEAIEMNENCCVKFEVSSLLLTWLFIIKIDLSTWNGERLHSRYVEVCPLIGEINDAEIKRLMRAIPGGPHLLKNYISHLHDYIRTKEEYEGDKSFLPK